MLNNNYDSPQYDFEGICIKMGNKKMIKKEVNNGKKRTTTMGMNPNKLYR